MKSMKLISVTFIILLSSCAYSPKVLQGDFSTITPAQSKLNHETNVDVRWSGYIAQTVNKKDKTCFEIIPSETNQNLRPTRIIPKTQAAFLLVKMAFSSLMHLMSVW